MVRLEQGNRLSCIKKNQKVECTELAPGSVLGTSETYEFGTYDVIKVFGKAVITVDGNKDEVLIESRSDERGIACTKKRISPSSRSKRSTLECK